MNKKLLLAIAGCLAMTACSLLSPDAQSVLQSSQKAMGGVKSIQYSGTGMNAFFGQALTAGKEWPRRPLTSYTRTINYDQKSGSEDMMFANPVFGGQHQNTQVSGDKAWTVGPNGPAPQIAQAEARQLKLPTPSLPREKKVAMGGVFLVNVLASKDDRLGLLPSHKEQTQ